MTQLTGSSHFIWE